MRPMEHPNGRTGPVNEHLGEYELPNLRIPRASRSRTKRSQWTNPRRSIRINMYHRSQQEGQGAKRE